MILQAIGRPRENPKSWCWPEPTITEMLSDSIVLAMMEADGVDPIALEAELRSMAESSTADRCPGPSLQPD
jgi:hypothetical protein